MIVCTRAQKDSHPAQIFLLGSCLGGLIGLPSVIQETWSLTDVAIIAYLGVFQTGLASALYSMAIRQVPALESNLILMLEPVLNPLWVFLVIGESQLRTLVGRRHRAWYDSCQGHRRGQEPRRLRGWRIPLQKGWGEIYGPQEFRQQVLDALAELRSQAVDIPDNEPESASNY